ncbi:hypothetical protein TcWFU_004597 [Taenia crassiceps]|uniref:Uncharacterized protein n=1 Tax=Taenia crassiceps TaxID=6207 RepID=A0ABR4QSD1_9CEST
MEENSSRGIKLGVFQLPGDEMEARGATLSRNPMEVLNHTSFTLCLPNLNITGRKYLLLIAKINGDFAIRRCISPRRGRGTHSFLLKTYGMYC